ncbi:cupin domain-containing protein [Patulibacter minatonensis]|uniref:cupin domain-containing protein n=1 Tax=Patulibacter minatonensis TaxID=298163 RepID=UPI0004AE1B3E|nr:cupin domain-containing protein [Patulibacter minatonensis]
MADWTRKNFADLQDRSTDADMQWRFSRNAVGSKDLGVSRFTYAPGKRMPFGHAHREQEEVYVVVAGSGRAKLDDEIVDVVAGDVVRVAPPVVRAFEAGDDGLELLCVGGRKAPSGDTIRVPDFWV